MSKVYDALKRAEREGRLPAAPPAEAEPAAETDAVEIASAAVAPPTASAVGHADSSLGRADATDLPLPVAPETYPRPEGSAGGRLNDWWRILIRPNVRPVNSAPLLVGHAKSMGRAAEKFQLLRVWFENWVAANQKRVVMVSSAVPGEGKSFVALNLAVTLATAGHRVLLVDADLRRPCLHRGFNIVPLHGLIDYLEQKADFASCQTTIAGLPTLRLVAAGGATELAAELVAHQRMRDFVAEARALEPPHYVLIDAPAALAVPETEILAGMVDAALAIVAANSTPRRVVKEALKLLKDTTTCGVVLNRFETSFTTSRQVEYGYYGQLPDQPASGLH